MLDAEADAEAVRNVLVAPFAGEDVREVAKALERELSRNSRMWRLPGKFGFSFDAGPCPLGDAGLDVSFEAIETRRFVVRLGGAPEAAFGPVPFEEAIAVAVRIAEAFLTARDAMSPTPRRLREVVAALGAEQFAARAGLSLTAGGPAPLARPLADLLGSQRNADGSSFVGVALPFGRVHSRDLRSLAEAASLAGVASLLLTPWRALLAPCRADAVDGLISALSRLDLILDPGDARLKIAACPGAPDCRNASTNTRADALALAPLIATLSGPAPLLHLSGCAKGCAHAKPTRYCVVSNARGYDLVVDGRPGDAPVRQGLSLAALRDALAAMPRSRRPMTSLDYIRDGDEIYRRSFAIIRAEADLKRFDAEEERVAVRVIHACGMPEVAEDLVFSEGAAQAGIERFESRRADLLRRRDGGARRHARASAGQQRSDLHVERPRRRRSRQATRRDALRRRGGAVAGPARRFGRRDRQRADDPVSSAGTARRRRSPARLHRRHARRLRRRRGIQGRPDCFRPRAAYRRARAPGRKRDGGGVDQRSGEREGVSVAGRLYGIGLGPGDPELLTVKAARLIAECPVVAYFAKAGRRGNARTIADRWIAAHSEELPLYYPVTTEIPVDHPDYNAALSAFYETAANKIAGHLADGRDVALLAEGDPLFYGSFMHLFIRLRAEFSTEIVPGVTGMAGCSAAASAPMTWGDDVLTILPGTLPFAELVTRLRASDACVVMKLGRNFEKVKAAFAEAGLLARAIYVERGTMSNQQVTPLAEKLDGSAPYFSLVLMPGEGRRP